VNLERPKSYYANMYKQTNMRANAVFLVREEHCLKLFENSVLRRIIESKNEELHDLAPSSDVNMVVMSRSFN
jgi:hypothetical protein